MKVVEINTVDYGSTGKIMLQIAEHSRAMGASATTFSRAWIWQKGTPNGHIYFGSFWENCVHHVLSAFTGYDSCFTVFGTNLLLKELERIEPDIIQLHNLHGWYINLPLLFGFIKRHRIPAVWTLHDCWAFTGHCPHFTMANCNKWINGCQKCPQYKKYPGSFVDNSKLMYKLKKRWFSGVENMTIVTPSKWLEGLVKQSFLKDYPIRVINNGIDLEVFKPTESNFRQKYGISSDKFVLLGVAFGWGRRKGLDVFIELSRRLDLKQYQIVLVGTDDNVDKQLPKGIISIQRTQNQMELAQIYTAADLFINPTREEVLGMVNIESLACGTPVVTFKTGGSPETISKNCGSVVDCDDVNALENEIRRICTEKPYSQEACVERAKAFSKSKKYKEYIELYENCTHCTKRPI